MPRCFPVFPHDESAHRRLLCTLLLCLLAVTVTRPVEAFPEVDFAHDVLPILTKHCGECHTGKRREGGFTMNTRAGFLAGGESGAAVELGEPAESLLLQRIVSHDEGEWMPPEGPRVSAAEVASLERWIAAELPWEAGVRLGESAWEPPLLPREVELPPVRGGRSHPIDRLLDAELAARGQSAPAAATDAMFLRRATLDANGLLPTPADLQAFLADATPDKRTRLIDKLLANNIAYADHWLTTWNDLLRNDYTGTGFITKGRTQITGWLYAALRDNKPYDQFVRELISPTAEAAGFINGIKWRGEVNASQTRDIQFAQNISQVFLGINMKCASCHDSFVDRWTLSEAYNLAAIYAEQPLELNRCDKPTGKLATPKWIFPELGDVDPAAPKAKRLQQLAGLMTHPDNGRFTRTIVNRIWHRLMGRGIVHPVDAMHTQPWNEDLLDYLAVRFAADGYDLRQLIRLVMTSQAYQARTVVLPAEPDEDYVYAGPIAKRMTAEQLLDSIWQITGTNPLKAEAKVDRAPRQAQSDSAQTQQAQRATTTADTKPAPITAKWIWHPTAGVRRMALRKSFSLKTVPSAAKLVATCDNVFRLKVNGVTVAASKEWQQPVAVEIAPQLKQGANVIEVDCEMLGGACGFVCQVSMAAPQATSPIVTDKTWLASHSAAPDWVPATELHAHGRGPWGPVLLRAKPQAPNSSASPVRAALVKNDFLMRSLGRPHRDQVVTTRPAELTTLQAIDLANGEILANYLTAAARHLQNQAHGNSNAELIDWLYQFALARKPTNDERAVLNEVLGDNPDATPITAIEDLLWMVFMQPEFQIVR